MKKCCRCGETKPLDQFFARKGVKDGKTGSCKACNYVRLKAWKALHPDRIKELDARCYYANPERRLDRQRAKKYKLPGDKYRAWIAAQGGVCAICRRPDGRGFQLSVDHCHDTDRLRGLLCSSCNLAIGALGDTAEKVERAVEYLKTYRSPPSEPPPST